jgi:uncharacterized membrane protein YhaH (DUF805 family)
MEVTQYEEKRFCDACNECGRRILFALGMCMGLVPEWNAMKDGIIIGVIGLVVLLAMVIVRRKMDGKPAIVLLLALIPVIKGIK